MVEKIRKTLATRLEKDEMETTSSLQLEQKTGAPRARDAAGARGDAETGSHYSEKVMER